MVLLGWCCVCVVVEVVIVDFWCKYVGLDGEVVGMYFFGVFVFVL